MTADQLKQMSDEPVTEWQSRYMGDPRQPGHWQRATNPEWAKAVYERNVPHMNEHGWEVRPLYSADTVAAQQTLITRLISQRDAQEVLIGEHIAKQREAEGQRNALKVDADRWRFGRENIFPEHGTNDYGQWVWYMPGYGSEFETPEDAIDSAMEHKFAALSAATEGGE